MAFVGCFQRGEGNGRFWRACHSRRRWRGLTGDFIIEERHHFFVDGFVIAFERQDVVGVRFDDLAGDLLLAADDVGGDDASREFNGAQEGGDGGDLVGFLSGTLSWPRMRRLAPAQALTMERTSPPASRAWRRALPSMATISRSIASRRLWVQRMKQSWKLVGSRIEKTRVKVSSLGIPLGSGRKVANQSCLALPKSSMS